MYTFQNLYETYQDNTDDTTANTTVGKAHINDTHKELLAMHDWYFAETTFPFTTVASDYTYDLPYNFGRMITVRIEISDVHYILHEVSSHEEWQKLHMYRDTSTSDIPEYFHVTGDSVEIYPVPSSAGNTGTFHYIKRVVDMANDDYTTGTVTATNASTTLTGSSTVWTAAMAGRFFKVNADARWYELQTFSTTTSFALKKTFQGTTASAAAYTIGEMPLIPEDYQSLLWMQPAARFWIMKKEPDQATYYQSLYEKGKKEFFNAYDKRSRAQILRPLAPRNRSVVNDVVMGNTWDEGGLTWDTNLELWNGS